MILVDLNQVMIAALMVNLDMKKPVIEEDYTRHIMLNSIRAIKKKFGSTYGDMILCSDNKDYWRKHAFPYYKIRRKSSQKDSAIDWNHVFEILNKIKNELKTVFPYKFIEVKHAEADDIIGTLSEDHGSELPIGAETKILIISGDKDFIQLQKYTNVVQFDKVRDRWIKDPDPEQYLYVHILKGDAGDDIPNILSKDDTFVTKTRQRPITQKKIAGWKDGTIEMSEEEKRNFKRNTILVDLSKVPDVIKTKVREEFDTEIIGSKRLLTPYFMQHNLKELYDKLGDF